MWSKCVTKLICGSRYHHVTHTQGQNYNKLTLGQILRSFKKKNEKHSRSMMDSGIYMHMLNCVHSLRSKRIFLDLLNLYQKQSYYYWYIVHRPSSGGPSSQVSRLTVRYLACGRANMVMVGALRPYGWSCNGSRPSISDASFLRWCCIRVLHDCWLLKGEYCACDGRWLCWKNGAGSVITICSFLKGE